MSKGALALEEPGDLLGVLGHADRLRLLQELRGGPRDVASLVAVLGLSQSRTSQHLALLKAHRIVEGTHQGRNAHHRLREPQLAQWLLDGLRFLDQGHTGSLQASISALQTKHED